MLAVVYNAVEDRSDLVILDATDFGSEPVATVALPQRVPVRLPRHLGGGSRVASRPREEADGRFVRMDGAEAGT